MNQFGISCVSLSELLKTPYYNIGCILMASKGHPEHLIHFYGEGGAFNEIKKVMDYSHFLRNVDHSTYPIGITHEMKILRPHHEVASALIAGKKNIYYMVCREGAPDYGDSWLKDYSKKDEVIQFYREIPELYQLSE